MKRVVFFSFIVSLGTWLSSCEGRFNTYSSSAEAYDSLFLGFHLGMERQAFYDHCWEMNHEQVFTNGPTNQSVEYILQDILDQPVSMQFYPVFYKNKIVDMPVTFSYQAWAPWNKQYSSDSLFVKILPLFKEWYGAEFKTIQHPTMGIVYVKMDGKRRINLFIRDDQFVQAVFTDMELDTERKAEESN